MQWSSARRRGALVTLAACVLLTSCGGRDADARAGGGEASAARTLDPDAPGVREVGPNRYEAVIHAIEGGFQPAEIRVPSGATVVFRVRSLDVPHGFAVERTDIGVDVFPPAFVEIEHTFETPGEYPFLCHVYCGGGHDDMRGMLIVEVGEGG